MAIYDDEWFEIWYTGEEVLPVYILFVVSYRKNIGTISVIDPYKNNKTVYIGKSYEEVCSWLWEDEYHLVEGRVFRDDDGEL